MLACPTLPGVRRSRGASTRLRSLRRGRPSEAAQKDAASGSCRTPRRLKLPTDWLQRRTAKPHRDFIGAVLCPSVAYLIGVTHVAPSHTDEVLIGPIVGYRRDHYSITLDV